MSSALDKLSKRSAAVTSERILEIALDKVRFDPNQPRKAFHTLDGQVAEKDTAYIAELAQSIEAHGLIQEITVQEMADGTYLVVVGECRTRAHLLLNRKVIRAIIRNDLTDISQRLLYQLSENVNRQDLTDDELALSIRDLMKGSATAPAMTQVAIANTLGKSEGWVSRFVKFGDEELQRLWVKTGIADTVEKLYRLSILPKAVQVDVMRRVELPEGDSERLTKPLLRDVIDQLAREAKIAKRSELTAVPAVALPAAPGVEQAKPFVVREYAQAGDDAGQALAQVVVDSFDEAQASALGAVVVAPVPLVVSDKYVLPAEARAAILGTIPDINDGAASREAVQAPVHCRVSVSNVLALLEVLKVNADVCGAFDGVQCELNIPGPLAQLIANQLVGVIVDRKEVPATVQMALAKLR